MLEKNASCHLANEPGPLPSIAPVNPVDVTEQRLQQAARILANGAIRAARRKAQDNDGFVSPNQGLPASPSVM